MSIQINTLMERAHVYIEAELASFDALASISSSLTASVAEPPHPSPCCSYRVITTEAGPSYLWKNRGKRHRKARAQMRAALVAEANAALSITPPVVELTSARVTHVVRAALYFFGPGCVIVAGLGNDQYLDEALDAVEQTRMEDRSPSFLFNSTTLRVLKILRWERSGRDDCARNIGTLQDGSLGTWESRRMANRSVQLVTAAWRSYYVSREPKVLMSAPSAAR